MKVAISGAGVAGPALAFWLHRQGHVPTLIEKAPRFRTGGYVIDFWGLGYTLAERMGVLPAVLAAGYKVRDVRFVDNDGRTCGGFSADMLRDMLDDRFVSLPRGDLAEAIYHRIDGSVETIFDDGITSLEEHAAGVRVALAHGGERDFDLVVGADGLHSRVRELAFGREERFEQQLGYRVAAFEVQGYAPRDELVYVSHTTPGRQVARFAMRDNRTLILFVFAADLLPRQDDGDDVDRKRLLREVYADSGWECPAILDAMDTADDVYYDRVSQVRMPRWSTGRIALVGDAAACVSLLAGEGTGLAMTEAYVLAGELQRAGDDYPAAFQRYEERLRTFIEGKQESARKFASAFAPKTATGVWLRNQVSKLMRIPIVARYAIGSDLRDDVELPDYRL